MDNEPSKVVGHVKAHYEGNRFVYHVEWTGPKAEVQELGWIFTMPNRTTASRGSATRCGRSTRHAHRPTHRHRSPRLDERPAEQGHPPDAYDFNSTKYNCRSASLTIESGAGLRVQFTKDDRHHCRGGVSDDGLHPDRQQAG
jgi:hypothetical protein